MFFLESGLKIHFCEVVMGVGELIAKTYEVPDSIDILQVDRSLVWYTDIRHLSTEKQHKNLPCARQCPRQKIYHTYTLLILVCGSQSVVLTSLAVASPGSLLELRKLWFHTQSESPEVRSSNLCYSQPSLGF